jgi:hypothetical protein
MRRQTLLAVVSSAVLLPALACSSSPKQNVGTTTAVNQAFSSPQADQLGTLISNVIAEGDYEQVTDDGTIQAAMGRLDGVVGPDALANVSNGADLQDVSSEVDSVTLQDGTVSYISYHTYGSSDGLVTINAVRVEDVQNGVTMYAERDLSQVDDNGIPTLVTSSLFSIDDQGNLSQLDNAVGDASNDPGASTSAYQGTLHLMDNGATTGFGNKTLCSLCTGTQYWLKGASWLATLLALHHMSFLGCAVIAAGGAVAGGAAGSEVPVAGTAVGAAAGATEAYRGCRIVTYAAAALAVLGPLLPDVNDTASQQRNCNTISAHIYDGPWCPQNIGPDSCALQTIQGASSPAAECVAVGQCAHDSGCPDAAGFCNGLFFGNSSQATSGRALCNQIAPHACAADIQSTSDLQNACSQVTASN